MAILLSILSALFKVLIPVLHQLKEMNSEAIVADSHPRDDEFFDRPRL